MKDEPDVDVEFSRKCLVAEQGDAEAQHVLASAYATGEGAPKDRTEALRWLRLAAEQEEAGALMQLADLYMMGEGVPKDVGEGIRLTRLAAKQGEPLAEEMLRELNKLTES